MSVRRTDNADEAEAALREARRSPLEEAQAALVAAAKLLEEFTASRVVTGSRSRRQAHADALEACESGCALDVNDPTSQAPMRKHLMTAGLEVRTLAHTSLARGSNGRRFAHLREVIDLALLRLPREAAQ